MGFGVRSLGLPWRVRQSAPSSRREDPNALFSGVGFRGLGVKGLGVQGLWVWGLRVYGFRGLWVWGLRV